MIFVGLLLLAISRTARCDPYDKKHRLTGGNKKAGPRPSWCWNNIPGVLARNTRTWHQKNKRKEKWQKNTHRGLSGIWNVDQKCEGTETYMLAHPIPYILRSRVICIYFEVYVRTDTWDRSSSYFAKENENGTPRREMTRARPRPPPSEPGRGEQGEARREQTAHRQVDIIASKIRSWLKNLV